MRFRTQSRPVAYGKPIWKPTQRVVYNGTCEICEKARFSRKRPSCREHIIPRRFCLERGWDPEREGNIINACVSCNAKKVAAENCLFGKGYVLEYLTLLNRISSPLADRAKSLLREYGWRFVGDRNGGDAQ